MKVLINSVSLLMLLLNVRCFSQDAPSPTPVLGNPEIIAPELQAAKLLSEFTQPMLQPRTSTFVLRDVYNFLDSKGFRHKVVNPAELNKTTWPPGAQWGGSYVIQPSEAVINNRNLQIVLPDDFTLAVDSDVTSVQWTVGSIKFGQRALIKLWRYQYNVSPPPPAPPYPGQPDYWTAGHQGYTGGSGGHGLNAASLTIDTLTISPTGSLWIWTDGGKGLPGGSGGKGQLGGGTKCDSDHEITSGPPGGPGGQGGEGGQGGSTASVSILNRELPVGYVLFPNACATVCGVQDHRPSNAYGDNGSITIWGDAGCGGDPGPGGPGGESDKSANPRQCHHLPFDNWNVWPGPDGPNGPLASVGPAGLNMAVEILGPKKSD
jgi:hypothetical protein